jgi:hypothetical protein
VFAAPAPVIGNTALDVDAVETVSIDSLATPVEQTGPNNAIDDTPPDAPAVVAEEVASMAPEDAPIPDAAWDTTPPPTLFSEPPPVEPAATEDVVAAPPPETRTQLSADDISYLFGADYERKHQVPDEVDSGETDALPFRPMDQAGSARPARRHTPGAGMRRPTPGRGTWRRVTPVLPSQAITPIASPIIRPTIEERETAEGATQAASPPLQAVPALRYPTPVAVPAVVNIESSRAVVRALETVAARVRAGELPIAGQVPIGDDPWALAAGVAAALAALLGVRG